MKYLVIILALLLSTNVAVATSGIGKCPMETKTALRPVDINKFSGHWYWVLFNCDPENSKYAMKCSQIFYTVKGFKIEISAAMYEAGKAVERTFSSSLPNSTGIMQLRPPYDGTNIPPLMNMMVLGTDYNNYAVVYLCIERGAFYHGAVQVASRTADLDLYFYSQIDEILIANGFETLGYFYRGLQDCGKYTCREENTDCAFSSINP